MGLGQDFQYGDVMKPISRYLACEHQFHRNRGPGFASSTISWLGTIINEIVLRRVVAILVGIGDVLALWWMVGGDSYGVEIYGFMHTYMASVEICGQPLQKSSIQTWSHCPVPYCNPIQAASWIFKRLGRLMDWRTSMSISPHTRICQRFTCRDITSTDDPSIKILSGQRCDKLVLCEIITMLKQKRKQFEV